MKSFGFKYFQFSWKIYETISSRLKTVNSQSSTLSENEYDDNIKQIENITGSSQSETSVEPNTNPTENTEKNPLQIPESSSSEKPTR